MVLTQIQRTLLPTFASMLTVAAAFSTNATLIAISANYMVHCLVLLSRWLSSAA